jgi:hypothetical protein
LNGEKEMATKLDGLRNRFSTGNIIKEAGTGANFSKVMSPTGKGDITPYTRERSYAGTDEFDQQFNIPDRVNPSENEAKGAKIIAENAIKAASNKKVIVEAQLKVDKARTEWYEADQQYVKGVAEGSLKRFEEKIQTQKMLDSQAPKYMQIVGNYANENVGAVNVMRQLDKIENSMKL